MGTIIELGQWTMPEIIYFVLLLVGMGVTGYLLRDNAYLRGQLVKVSERNAILESQLNTLMMLFERDLRNQARHSVLPERRDEARELWEEVKAIRRQGTGQTSVNVNVSNQKSGGIDIEDSEVEAGENMVGNDSTR